MQIAGVICLILSILLSRILNEKAFRKLDDEAKLRLMNGFSKSRAYSMIPLVVLILLFLVLMTQTSLEKSVVMGGYLGALCFYIIYKSIYNHKKLKSLDMPDDYRKYFTISQVISLIGAGVFILGMMSKLK